MSKTLFQRLLRHLFVLPSQAKRYFPLDAMHRIETAIASNETFCIF